MSGDAYKMPECPICGAECNELYIQADGNEIVGCDVCIHTESAYERLEADAYSAKIDYYYDRRRDGDF